MDQSVVTCTFCTVCDFLKLVETLFYYLLATAFVVAVFFVILNGIIRIVSVGVPELVRFAKKGFRMALTGFAVVLIAWLCIHTFYSIFGVKGNSWWSFNCEEETAGINQDNQPSSKYSTFNGIKPVTSLNQIINGNTKIGVLDLRNVDRENLKQDVALLYPGEQVKFLAGYGNFTQDDLNNLVDLLNGNPVIDTQALNNLANKVQEMASLNMYDGGPTVVAENDYSQLTSGPDPTDYNFSDTLDKLINQMLQQTLTRVIVYKSGNSEVGQDSCLNSGGDWIEFFNGCTANKQTCGKENITCTGISNPTGGCQCPEGSCLVNGKCTARTTAENTSKDDDGDGIKNNLDKCAGTPKGETVNKDSQSEYYGCSCSQINLITRNCPATRCEGTNLVSYPQSGQDTCSDGVVTQYSCNPTSSSYNASCDQTQNINSPIDRANQIQQLNNNLYNQLKDWLSRNTSNSGSGSNGSSSSGGGKGGNNGNGSSSSSSSSGGGNNKGNNGSNNGGNNSSDNGGNNGTPDNTSPGRTVPAEDFKPSGDFKAWEECAGLKPGEIPQNGFMIGRCRDQNCNTMEIRYLSPEGKVLGNNGDTGGQALIGYPNPGKGGFASAAQKGQAAIYATQVQNHVSPGSNQASPLTMRGDKRIWANGKTDSITSYNIHGGQNTAGCLGLGSRNNYDNFMNKGHGGPWDDARSYGDGKTDGVTQANPNAYKPYRTNDTVLFEVLPYGTMNDICNKINPYQAIDTLKKQNGYDQYDPKWLEAKS